MWKSAAAVALAVLLVIAGAAGSHAASLGARSNRVLATVASARQPAVKLTFVGQGTASHVSNVSPPGLGLPASARAELNWTLNWILDNSPLENQARVPKQIYGTFFQQGGTVQPCSGSVSADQQGTQPYESQGFTKSGNLVYGLSVPLIIGTTVSTCVGQASGTLWFGVLPTAPNSIAYADVTVLGYVPASPLAISSAATVSGNYSGASMDGGFNVDIHWQGTTIVVYPPSSSGYYIGPALRPAAPLTIIEKTAQQIRAELTTPGSRLRQQGGLSIALRSPGTFARNISITLAAKRTILGKGSLTLGRKQPSTLRFSLTSAGRRTLTSGHAHRATVKLTIALSGPGQSLSGSESFQVSR